MVLTHAPLVIGLTGGIGSGKTVVSNLFAELGITVIDTDVLAREVVAPHRPALAAIVDHFGPDLLLSNHTLNRRLLREKIFADPAERQWLEQLLHPLIREATAQHIAAATSPYVIAVIPLLTETTPNPLINRVLVVDAPEALQIARAAERDHVAADSIRTILEQQSSREKRLSVADDIIENDGDFDQLRAQVYELHQKYLQIAANSA